MTVLNGDKLRASARFRTASGQDNVNVYWFTATFAAPQTDEDVFDAIDLYLTSVYSDFDQYLRTAYEPLDLKVDVVEMFGGEWSVIANVGFGSWGAGIATIEGSDQLPEGVAAVAFLQTGLGKHQGRKFLGGLTEGDSDVGGNLVTAVTDAITTGMAKLITPYLISAGNTIVSKVADHTSGVMRDILEVTVDTVPGYQRRRRPGRGS